MMIFRFVLIFVFDTYLDSFGHKGGRSILESHCSVAQSCLKRGAVYERDIPSPNVFSILAPKFKDVMKFLLYN
jgi:hypothetical protein